MIQAMMESKPIDAEHVYSYLIYIYFMNAHCSYFQMYIIFAAFLWSFIVIVKVLAKTKKIQFKVSSTWNELIKHERELNGEHFIENHFLNIQSMYQTESFMLTEKE